MGTFGTQRLKGKGAFAISGGCQDELQPGERRAITARMLF